MPNSGLLRPLSDPAARQHRRRTALVVVWSLLLGLVGTTGVTTSPPAEAAVSATLANQWKFDAGTGTTAVDSVGGKTATLGSGASWATSPVQGTSALALNGASTANAVTSGSVLNTTSSFSVSAYVKLNNLTGYQTIASQDGGSASSFYLQLRADTGKFAFSRLAGDNTTSAVTYAGAPAAPVVGQWYHLTGVYNSGANTLALYVNGRLQQSVTAPTAWASTGNFAVGRGKYNGGNVDAVNGAIDDVRAYSGALTAADVQEVSAGAYWKFDEGTGTTTADETVSNYDGTLTNGASFTRGVVGPNATLLDGADDHVAIANRVVDTGQSFSVAAWARTDQNNARRAIASVNGGNVSAFTLQVTDTGKWGFTRRNSDSSFAGLTDVESTGTAVTGTWYHLVGVYDSVADTMSLYVNGVKQGTVSYTSGWEADGNFVIGRGRASSSPDYYFDGAIDDVEVFPFVVDDAMATSLAAPPAPPAPATPTVTLSGYSVTVSWVAPAPVAGSPTTGYVVRPYVNGTAQTPQTFDTTATSQTFTGLTGGSSYRYTVAAINGNGTGTASGQSTAVTPAAATPPAAPAAPTATAGTQSATVSWTAPANNGSPITGYVVTPYIGTTAQTARTFASAATSQVITGLTAGTAYTFRVSATNSAGTGPASPASPAVTPNAPLSITSATPPAGQVGVAYSHQYVRSGGTSPYTWSVSGGTLPTGLTLSSSGLLSGTPTTPGSYAFTVRVVDASNASTTSSATLVVRDEPATPATPTANAGVTSATVSWTAPANNGGAITGYTVTPYLNGTAQAARTFNSTATTQTVTGLTAGGSYRFTVAATNGFGTSGPSAQSAAVVPYDVPGAPAAPTGTAGAQSVTLTWTAPSTNGSAITGYRVTPFIGTTAQAPRTFASTSTTQTITGLTAGTGYTFTVEAQNAAGYGADSAASAVLTPTADRPATPAAPTATAGTTSATVSWAAPVNNGSPLTGYVVTPYLNGVAQTPVSYDASATTRTITGLTAAGSYTFTVQAVNAVGTSSQSAQSNTVTPYNVPSAPTITAATAGTQRVTLTWTAPNSNGSTVTGYVVTPYIGATAQTPQTFASAALTQTVTGLTGGTAYTFRVAAQNAAGTGPASAASSTVTPNAAPTLNFGNPPLAPVGVAYSNQFAVSGGTSPFTWSISAGSLPSGMTLSNAGLLSGTPTVIGNYTFTVRVVDANNVAATRSVTLAVADKPATPASPSATAGLTSAVLTWTAPANNNSTITAYVITPVRDGVAQSTITVDPSAKTRTLTGLTAGSVYTFTIAARSAVGTSAASSASNPATPYAELSAPTITSVTAGTTSARLSWTAPTSTGGSPVTGYVVTPYVNGVAQTPQTFNSAATTQTLTGLTPGTAYTFRVAALNNSGSTVQYRIDAGGAGAAATDDGPDWAADNAADNPLRNSGSSASDLGAINDVDWTVPSTTPWSTFNTERWDPAGGNPMSWAIPVTAGAPVKVRLYFVNGFSGTTAVGARTFDMALEGSVVLPAFDPVAASGGHKIGTMREFAITSDGTVNLDFSHIRDNPIINGIEIIQTGTATTGPQSSASSSVTPNDAPTVVGDAVANGQVNVAYTKTFTVNGGTSPFTWSVSSGALPAGLTLNASTGVLSGTPTTAGTSTFTVGVTDASGQSDTRDVTLVVVPPPTVTFAPAAGQVNVPYSQQATVTGGTGPYTWAVSAGSLPAGLTLNASTGVVSGTPTAPGSFSVTLRVTDAHAQAATKTASIVIAASPTLTSVPPAGRFGVGYSFTFSTNGGTAPFTYSVVSGTLPTGITLSSAGVLSGNPRQVGSFPFTVKVVDANGQSATNAVTLVVEPAPVQVSHSANTTSAAPGDTVRFTVTATNISSTAYNNVEFTEPLSGLLDDATYNTDVSVTSGSATLNGSALVWTVNMAANTTQTLTYTVTVKAPAPGDKRLTSTVSSSRVSSNCYPDSPETSCSATVTVSGLSIAKTASAATTTPGSTVTFTVVVTNSGQTPLTGATFTDNLGGSAVLDDAIYEGATATVGTPSYSSSTLIWTGNLAVGASATITYSVTVKDPATGNRSLSSTIVSSTAGSTCPGGSPAPACTAAVTVLVPALSISNAPGQSTAIPGDTVTSAVTVTNTGQTAYTGITVNVALAGAADDSVLGGYSATGGTVTLNLATATLVWSGDLAVGAAVTINIAGTVRNPDPGNRWVTTVASSSAAGSTCPPGSLNAACTANIQVLVPELTFTKSADVTSTTPGSVVRYTVVATNTGQTAYTGAAFSDSLAGVLDDADFNGNSVGATSGTLSVTSSAVSWTGDLAVGATATVTYTVTVRNPPGDKSLTGRVTSTTPFNNCASASTDPRCASTVAVQIPSLAISVSSNVATATPGTVVRYDINVTNNGETTYSGAKVNISLAGVSDDATYNFDGTVSTGTVTPAALNTSVWTLSLAPGQTATSTRSFTVKSSPGDKSMPAVASSNEPGSNCPVSPANPSCTATVTVLMPGLTLTKTASAANVTPGDTVDYTVTVVNSGETSYPTASFSDDLATVLTDSSYVTGSATATLGTVTVDGSMLSWSGALAQGATATVSYSVKVLDPDPGDKRMINTVVSNSQGSNCAPGSADPACTAEVSVLVPQLTIVSTTDRATAVPGATIEYTVTVTNSGATPYTGAGFTDALSGTGVLDDATYNGDAQASTGTVGYSASQLTWAGDLAVGASATVTYTVTVKSADVGNDLVRNAVTSSTRGSNCAAAQPQDRCSATVPVSRLTLVRLTPGGTTTTPGSVVNLPVVFTNTGAVAYTGITVDIPRADSSDDLLPGGDDVPSSGTLTRTTSTTRWTGDIPLGGEVTIPIIRTVRDPATGNRMIRARLVSSAPGNNCAPGSTDPRCDIAVQVLVPKLTITKAASTTAAAPGQQVSYTITVNNNGETPYTGATLSDPLTALLDDATFDNNAVATLGNVSYNGSTLSWTGDLPVGATATITYSVTTSASGTGDKLMVNTATSDTKGSSCTTAAPANACRSTVVVLTPALTIEKSAGVSYATLGSTVTYTIKVTNTGQTSYASASFTDSLNAALDDAAYNENAAVTSGGGAVSYSTGVLSWSGSLAPGASATIAYSVTVDLEPTGDRSMTDAVTSTTAGNNCPVNSNDSRCKTTVAVTDSVALTITNTPSVATTVVGATVTFTVKLVNASQQAILGASFVDPLDSVLDDATYHGATADAGVVSFDGHDLTWTGDVPADGFVTVTYSVTVNSTMAGDEMLQSKVVAESGDVVNDCPVGSTDPRCSESVPVAALVINELSPYTAARPGDVLSMSATFTNVGQVPYEGITIYAPGADLLDDAVGMGDQTATSGTFSVTPTAIAWTGNIPVGGSVTVSAHIQVRDPANGDKTLRSTWLSEAAGSNCAAGSVDPRCTTEFAIQVPQLSITKAADQTSVSPGDVVAYTITAKNTGESPYDDVTLTDDLVGVLEHAAYNSDAVATGGSGGSLDDDGSVLSWTGDLAVGATLTITYSVTTNSVPVGDKTMTNAVTSEVQGSSCPAAAGNPACVSTVGILTPELRLTSTASVASTTPGAPVTYTVTATNTGQTSYSAAAFNVALAGVLDDAIVSTAPSASSGSAAVTGKTLDWNGPLPIQASVTVTFTVTVNEPDVGDHLLAIRLASTEQGSTCPTGNALAECATTVPVADLKVVNTADVPTTKPGSVVRYLVTFTNAGQVDYLGTTLSYNLVGAVDDAVYNGDATATSGNLTLFVGQGRVAWTGDIPVGQTVTIEGSMTVRNPYPALADHNMRTIVTTAAAGTNCASGSTDPDCTADVPVLIPQLSITKVADTATASPGATVGYTITVHNTGEAAYTGATVTDPLAGMLDEATYQNDATSTEGTVAFADSTLTWTGDLGLDETATITYSVVVNSPALGDKLLFNQAVSNELGSTCPQGTSAAACRALVSIRVPALAVSLAANSTTTTPGSAVSYTLTVRNTGETDYLGAVATVSLAGVLDDATYGGEATATSGTAAYSSPNLTWTGDLPQGATATTSFTVSVAQQVAGDHQLSASVSSPDAGSTCTEAMPCVSSVQVLIPGLSISTAADVETAIPGDTVAFSLTIANTGETSYTNAVVTATLADVLDDATYNGAFTASTGTVAVSGNTLMWTGSLAVTATATVTVYVEVSQPGTGNKLLRSTVSSGAAGSSCPNGATAPACTASVSVLVPQLTITKSASLPSATPGATVSYTITIANTGETAYAGATVTDPLGGLLGEAAYGADAVVTGAGAVSYADSTLTWTGDLGVGATTTVTYSVQVNSPATGDRVLTNSVTSGEPGSTCPNATASTACTTSVPVRTPELTITKSASTTAVMAGKPVTYTVTLTNSGETAYAPATFSDSLVEVLDDAEFAIEDATASSGTLSYSAPTLSWSGPLAVGAAATITYVVETRFPTTGDGSLENTVLSSAPGSTCVTGTDPRCRVATDVRTPAVAVTKSADTTHTVAGGTVRYTIVATNTGEADYPTMTVTDSLTDVLTHSDYGDDASSNRGEVVLGQNGVLSWTGPLAVGESLTITYSVTVKTTDPGNAALLNRVVVDELGSNCRPGSPAPGCTSSTVIDAATLSLTGMSSSFELGGAPGSTPEMPGAVAGSVTTNNLGGYTVTVQASEPHLSGQAGNPDRIPIDSLLVRGQDADDYTPISATEPVVVRRQNTPSSASGDALSNDYKVTIPFVAPDQYSTTLDYIVAAQ